jgi:branched-chain amino acid aminotransferase
MSVVVVINGRLLRPEDARISVFDRGLLFGDSVFETLGTYGGQPFALGEHLQRLRRSAELVLIEPGVSDEQMAQNVATALESAGNAESYVRIIVTRGSGELGLDPALAVDPQRIIIVTPLHRPSSEVYEHGVTAITERTNRVTDATLAAGAKVGNYLVAVLAMQKARAVSANEALIVDREGQVIEGATSNLFFVRSGALWTPGESAGILAGITRAVVIDAAQEMGIALAYGCPKVEELASVDELFITSSIRQILSVVAVDGRPIGDGRPGPVYRRLFERFRQIVMRSRPSSRC